LGAANGEGLGGVFVVVQLDFQLALGLFRHEVGADEGVDVAVHDAVNVSGAELCAVVLDHAVGLHNVGTNLAAEGDVELGFVELVGMGLALLDFEVVEAGAQHFHSHFAVFALAALGLAADDDVGGDVGYADGGFDLVDVLSALAAGAEGIDAQVFGANVDFDSVVDFGDHEDGRERSVAACGLIERRDADETVDAGLAGKKAVCVFTDELNGRGFDSGFFAGSFVEEGGVDSFSFRPAQIHTQEHRGPILRLGAASAGLDGHDGVEVIGLTGEERLRFQIADVGLRGRKLAVEIFQKIVALLGVGLFSGEGDVSLDVTGDGGKLLVGGNLFFGALAVAQNRLRFFLVVPEVGLGDAGFERFQAFAVLRSVKESSGRA